MRRLRDVMRAKALIDGLSEEMDVYYSAIMKKLLEGHPTNPKQQQAIDEMRQNVKALMKESFSWELMEPMYIEIYGKTFPQSEIDSLITFYSSPAGHALIVKMPLVLQNTMAVVQQRLSAMMPKLQQMANDVASKIKTEQDPAAAGKAG